jgi:hypothetical protein
MHTDPWLVDYISSPNSSEIIRLTGQDSYLVPATMPAFCLGILKIHRAETLYLLWFYSTLLRGLSPQANYTDYL